nr:ribonuclease H-like domain-containing protein [Tanacetum cinerariifolium]
MYSFNLKNIDPSRDLSCLFARASIDESNKWHTRLGHVNFKLVKGNLVKVENQANKSAGPKKANNSVGTQANDDQGANSEEIDLNEEHFVMPIWSACSTTVKSLGDKIEKNTDFKTSESLRKEATHDIQNANTSSTNLLNTVSTPLSIAGPSREFNDGELSYPDDPLMPHLEDIYASLSKGIFTDLSYDDEEEAPESKTPTEEVSEDKIKEMMHLVLVEDVYVQALQVKHPIIDWKVHSKGERNYWQIIRLGGSTACYQFFVDLLKQLDREDLNQLWALVKEYLSIIPASNDKEMELWVELKRMYEPDPEDQLWTLTQNYMHAPVEWKLYDLSGVHHVTAKDKEIFMLVEKDYPLRRGLALVMTSYRLQVENHSQMAEDLIKKIYNIANTPRKQSD